MKLEYIIFSMAVLFISCSADQQQNTNNPKTPVDSFESALPHTDALEGTKLSDEDKIKLAGAIGKQAELLSFDSLIYLIDHDSSGLVIYNFWNLDCKSCDKTMRLLHKLQKEVYKDQEFGIVHISIDDIYPKMINSYIRENEIIEPVYVVTMDSIQGWSYHFQNGWEGKLPAILIMNNLDGTKLFYQKEFSIEELEAVLFPLTF